MSAVFSPEEAVLSEDPKPELIDIREGDWKAYLVQSVKYRKEKDLKNHYEDETAYKRACAMAYLGRRAQFRGGVCSRVHPHILTQQFIAALETANKAQRFRRYPWLERWINLLAEIERIQDEIADNSNVISLIPGAK